MRKIIIISLFAILLSAKVVFAQNATRAEFSDLYDNYRKKYNEYIVAHDEYLLAKKQFEKFDTLTSREKAQKETAEMLIFRDEVMVSYYEALKARLDDISLEMDEQIKADRKSAIDADIQWYNEHKGKIKNTLTLKELVILSNDAGIHYGSNNNIIYLALFEITRARMTRYDTRFDELYQRVKNLTETIKVERREEYRFSDAKTERIDRWIGEVENKEGEYDEIIANTQKHVPVQGPRSKTSEMYNKAISLYEEALVILKQRISFVNEVIEEIKIAEK